MTLAQQMAASTLQETAFTSYISFPAKSIGSYSQIFSSCPYVLLKGTCSLAG